MDDLKTELRNLKLPVAARATLTGIIDHERGKLIYARSSSSKAATDK
jgi:hypothetical protein